MLGMGKKKQPKNKDKDFRCGSHEEIVRTLARIEAENILIILITVALIVEVILARM